MIEGASVHLDDLVKTFPAGKARLTAIDGVTVDIAAGSVTALTGASGSGKSTLLNLIGAVEAADRGVVRVGDTEVTALRRGRLAAYRRTVGFVFQRYHLLPALTALDNVIAPVLPFRVPYDKAARARELLDSVGLSGRERALPGQLSGGEQQRVAVARALMGEPRLLLADEPTGNLDSANGAQILDLLLRLRDERGLTVLLATHERSAAARCDRLLRLTDGRLVEDLDLAGDLADAEEPEATLKRANRLRL